MPPLPGMSWLPTIAPSSTTQRPPDLLPLAPLWPVLALTCQPSSVWPSKMRSKPASSALGGRCLAGQTGPGKAECQHSCGKNDGLHGVLRERERSLPPGHSGQLGVSILDACPDYHRWAPSLFLPVLSRNNATTLVVAKFNLTGCWGGSCAATLGCGSTTAAPTNEKPAKNNGREVPVPFSTGG